MKKRLCILLVLLLTAAYSSALAEQCKYSGQGSPCKPGWWVDSQSRLHCRACFTHVEDKEDINSHVKITDWAKCTVSDETGECTVCGWAYVKHSEPDDSEEMEMFMLELFFMASAEHDSAPVEASVSGNRLTISMTDTYFAYMEDFGLPVSETMMVATQYTLVMPQGDTYPYGGAEVSPNVEMHASEYGPGAWLEKYGLLTIGDVVYQNNIEPGTAIASVDFVVMNGETYTLKKTFTITGEPAERLPGDANGDGTIDLCDAFLICCYHAGESIDINWRNANVNGDENVDLYDALRILQHEAGWGVSLQ